MNERVIFVGGATIGLYINDPAAEDVRATKDVDITVKIASLGELETIRQVLAEKGFSHRETIKLGDQAVQILPLPYFIDSKFVAHEERGGKAPVCFPKYSKVQK